VRNWFARIYFSYKNWRELSPEHRGLVKVHLGPLVGFGARMTKRLKS
jgi:hypothetical protein